MPSRPIRPGSLRSKLVLRRRVHHTGTGTLAHTRTSLPERVRHTFRRGLILLTAAVTALVGLLTGWSPFLLLPLLAAPVLEPLVWRCGFRLATPWLSRAVREIFIDEEAAEKSRKFYRRGLVVDVGDRHAAASPVSRVYSIRFRDGSSRNTWALRWDGKHLIVNDRGGRTRTFPTLSGGVQTSRLLVVDAVGTRHPAQPPDGVPTVVELAMVRDTGNAVEWVYLLDARSRRLVSARVPPWRARRAVGRVAQRAGVDFVRYRLALAPGVRFEAAAEALFPKAVGHWQIPEKPLSLTFVIDA